MRCIAAAAASTSDETVPLRRLSLTVDDFQFDAWAAGPAHAPLVLFLHGFPQFADAWQPILLAIAACGYQAVAVDQRGYSPRARPATVDAYATSALVADALDFADALGAARFHLVGHDWGGLVAWQLAAGHPGRLLSLCVLSTPHTTAILAAIRGDAAQARMSAYIFHFREPDGRAERDMLGDDAKRLRAAYRGKVVDAAVDANVARLREPGALTAALNWYRALDMDAHVGIVEVPVLFVWGAQDHALGEAAALATAAFVRAPYRFVRLDGASHWLLDEAPAQIAALLAQHLATLPAISPGEHA